MIPYNKVTKLLFLMLRMLMMIGSQSSEAEVAASSLLGNLSLVDSPYPRARPRPHRRQPDRGSWLAMSPRLPTRQSGMDGAA